ncbi:hypothetical protein IV203_034197 [Nitzschia inconspicua]|uniref:DUF6824 domain-containing protein n=1 Tax=Nitzschia inconspicua TaxID=303405 RepID=A0A9K3M4B6_9STRA|nr:hypothetical protein IV203_034197 [Nitzschia inconspicua]
MMRSSGNADASMHSRTDSSRSENSHVSSTPTSPQNIPVPATRPEAVGKTSDSVLNITLPRKRHLPGTSKQSDESNNKVTRELMRMTLQQREQINEEIHGVYSLAVTESSELISRALVGMEQAIAAQIQREQEQLSLPDLSPPPKIPAYMEAQSMGAIYLHQPSFRLKFLRAALFNATVAVSRLFGFLQLVRDVLGAEALIKFPSSLSHFAFDEHSLLREGAFQILPGRDRVGRRIIGIFDDFGADRSLVAKFRVALYIMMVASDDEDTQKKGCVSIFFQNNPTVRVFNDPEERLVFQRLFDTIPLRTSAFHICLPDDSSNKYIQLQTFAMDSYGSEARKRMRIHTGSPTNMVCNLETFGIPAELIPINSNTGKLKTQNFAKWIDMRLIREEKLARAANAAGACAGRISVDTAAQHYAFPWIDCPSQQDVLLGRGRPIMNHKGNVTMRELVGSKLSRFNATTQKHIRTSIIEEVVSEIQVAGGRFLKEDPNMNGFWIEVDAPVARQKVGIYFRDLRCNSASPGTAAPVSAFQSSSSSTLSASTGSSRGSSPILVGQQSSERGTKRKKSDD